MSDQLPRQVSSASGPRSYVCPLCGVFLAPTGMLLTGDAVHSCADHGCYIVGPSTYWQPKEWDRDALPRLTPEVQQIGLWLAFKCLLAGADGDHLLVDDLDEPEQYVQLELQSHGDGTMYVEVGSRDWADSHRPLLPGAIAALDGLGFSGGGRNKNYSAAGFFPDPDGLTWLTQRLFAAAYPESSQIRFVVVFKNAASAQACLDLLCGTVVDNDEAAEA
jgi:hypothetical protein